MSNFFVSYNPTTADGQENIRKLVKWATAKRLISFSEQPPTDQTIDRLRRDKDTGQQRHDFGVRFKDDPAEWRRRWKQHQAAKGITY